jgi:hypothetical protein
MQIPQITHKLLGFGGEVGGVIGGSGGGGTIHLINATQ